MSWSSGSFKERYIVSIKEFTIGMIAVICSKD